MSGDGNRVPPYSAEAEVGLLGCVLLESYRLAPMVIAAGTTPEWFYVPANRLIWEQVAELSARNRPVDILTVTEGLKASGNLDRAGGPTALDRIVDATPTVAHVEYYLDIVRKKARLRHAISICREVEQEALTTDDGDKLVSGLSDRFMAIYGEPVAEATNAERINGFIEKWKAVKAGGSPAIGIETPFYRLTQTMCGFETGLTIVAGRPSAGKTTLEDMFSLHAAGELNIPVARVTLDSTADELLQRSVCRFGQVSLPKLKFGYAREDQISKAAESSKQIAELPFWINDRDTDLAQIRAWFRLMVARRGVCLGTVDYIQLIWAAEMGRQNWETLQRVTYVSGQLKALSLELKIPMIVLSQLSRGNAKEKREPELEDLRDSGAIEQDASKVILIWIDEKKKKEMEAKHPGATKHKRPVWIKVAKHKNGETGKIPFWLYPAYFRFQEAQGEFEDDELPGEVERTKQT